MSTLLKINVTAAVKKESRAALAGYMTDNLLSAHSPAQALVLVRSLQKALEVVAEGLIASHLAGAGKVLEHHWGAEVKVKRLPKWEYDTCGDPVLAELQARAREVKDDIASRQMFLRHIGGETIDKTTGEVIKTTSITIDHLGKPYTINRAVLVEAGETVEVRLP